MFSDSYLHSIANLFEDYSFNVGTVLYREYMTGNLYLSDADNIIMDEPVIRYFPLDVIKNPHSENGLSFLRRKLYPHRFQLI